MKFNIQFSLQIKKRGDEEKRELKKSHEKQEKNEKRKEKP
tara:strand:- start:14 stop:133 length:120 start_codon:yes stop_codon:yes gene_type:complete